jgi:uncharacterized membrane protein YoaK (UPF0700 family)
LYGDVSLASAIRHVTLAGLLFRAVKLGATCTAFLAGATLGAFVAPCFPAHAIFFAVPPLFVTLLLSLFRPIPDPAL